MQVRSPNPLPDDVVNGAVADIQRLLVLEEEQRSALFESLEVFVPSGSTIERGEMEEIAKATNVDSAAIAAASRLAVLMHGSDRPGALNTVSVRNALKQALAETQIAGTDSLLEALAALGKTMGARFARAQRLERVLPSLVGTVISCDLRYLQVDTESGGALSPVAIIRLEIDELDDTLFQCSLQKLKSFIRSLQGAVDDLSRLEKLAQKMPGL